LATVTPSLVTIGEPYFFVDDDVTALGSEGGLDCFAEQGYAAEQVAASFFVEHQLFSHVAIIS